MNRHRARKLTIASWVAMGTTVFLLGLLMYWSILPFKPILEIPNNKMFVINKGNTVNAGENLLLHYKYCKRGDGLGLITRYLQDNQVITLPDVNSKQPGGCGEATIPVMIPSNTPTDTYTFHATVTYKVSPIKTVSYDLWTDEFTIKGKIL